MTTSVTIDGIRYYWYQLDKNNWPIETYKGKPVKSFIRIIFQLFRKVTNL